MTIEEGEKLFGKRWNLWTKEEQIQFVEALDGTEGGNPGILNLACRHWQHVPDAYEKGMKLDIKKRMAAAFAEKANS